MRNQFNYNVFYLKITVLSSLFNLLSDFSVLRLTIYIECNIVNNLIIVLELVLVVFLNINDTILISL